MLRTSARHAVRVTRNISQVPRTSTLRYAFCKRQVADVPTKNGEAILALKLSSAVIIAPGVVHAGGQYCLENDDRIGRNFIIGSGCGAIALVGGMAVWNFPVAYGFLCFLVLRNRVKL